MDTYGLSDWGDRLEEAWVSGDASLRELADRFNRALLQAAMLDAGLDPAPGEVDARYRALTDDDATAGQRSAAKSTLGDAGVDLSTLEAAFVSHQAVHTYLTKHRDVRPPTSDRDPIEAARERLQRLESRHRAVVTDVVENLAARDEISVGPSTTLISAQVICGDCGRQYDVASLLERGGCECTR